MLGLHDRSHPATVQQDGKFVKSCSEWAKTRNTILLDNSFCNKVTVIANIKLVSTTVSLVVIRQSHGFLPGLLRCSFSSSIWRFTKDSTMASSGSSWWKQVSSSHLPLCASRLWKGLLKQFVMPSLHGPTKKTCYLSRSCFQSSTICSRVLHFNYNNK